MAKYLLSVHSVEGEVGVPMTDEEMQQSWKQIQVLKSVGAWVEPLFIVALAAISLRTARIVWVLNKLVTIATRDAT